MGWDEMGIEWDGMDWRWNGDGMEVEWGWDGGEVGWERCALG